MSIERRGADNWALGSRVKRRSGKASRRIGASAHAKGPTQR